MYRLGLDEKKICLRFFTGSETFILDLKVKLEIHVHN